MPCLPGELKHIPLFSLLDDDELAILAAQVEVRKFAARQRIYKIGDIGKNAFVVMTGSVHVTTVDTDHQEVLLHQAGHGEFFGFASMLEETAHQTNAMAVTDAECVEIDRNDISVLLQKKPMAGMDLLTVIGRQFHETQELVRLRASRNANELIDEEETFGERIADKVAQFGGSWTFIIAFGITLSVYTAINVFLRGKAWDPYPFILLNLFLSMLAAIQAPVIMMSQNRQDSKDRVRSELDYEVNLRAETEIQAVSSRLNLLTDKIGDLDDLLRAVKKDGEQK
jgi:CRP/FNR family transcriptional regulator, cyclic AMP receptor protein